MRLTSLYDSLILGSSRFLTGVSVPFQGATSSPQLEAIAPKGGMHPLKRCVSLAVTHYLRL